MAPGTRPPSEDRFRQLAEHAPHAMLVADAEGRIRWVNSQVSAWFGYSPAELNGRDIDVLIPERYRTQHRGHVSAYARAPTLRPMGTGRELYARRKDGSEFPVDISLSPISTPEGLQIVASIVDISERRRIEESLREANRTVAAVNSELESFAFSVSHDLRAPLRTLVGFSDILITDKAQLLDEEGLHLLRRIVAAGQHMGQLIDDMLTLSRVTREEIHKERVDLSALAEEILGELRAAEPRRHVQSNVAKELYAMADPRQVRILLDNLLRNAWKFSGKVAQARIDVGAVSTEHGPAFYVQDNGAGFDMAYARKLFGAFARLHSAEEFPGTGIGLATARRVVTRHGGRIWAEGHIDAGATFTFTL